MTGDQVAARLFTGDGVTPVPFERRGDELVNDGPISMGPGDFVVFGEAGTYTLRLETLPVDPAIEEWFFRPPGGPLDV